jgi:hypothetical protein
METDNGFSNRKRLDFNKIIGITRCLLLVMQLMKNMFMLRNVFNFFLSIFNLDFLCFHIDIIISCTNSVQK